MRAELMRKSCQWKTARLSASWPEKASKTVSASFESSFRIPPFTKVLLPPSTDLLDTPSAKTLSSMPKQLVKMNSFTRLSSRNSMNRCGYDFSVTASSSSMPERM